LTTLCLQSLLITRRYQRLFDDSDRAFLLLTGSLGTGGSLVAYLLSRCGDSARLVTLPGELGLLAEPHHLYRSYRSGGYISGVATALLLSMLGIRMFRKT
jgi:hypothetical protein